MILFAFGTILNTGKMDVQILQCFTAKFLTDANALDVVCYCLRTRCRICMGETAELVTMSLILLIREGVGVHGIKSQAIALCGLAQFTPVAAFVPRNVQRHRRRRPG